MLDQFWVVFPVLGVLDERFQFIIMSILPVAVSVLFDLDALATSDEVSGLALDFLFVFNSFFGDSIDVIARQDMQG